MSIKDNEPGKNPLEPILSVDNKRQLETNSTPGGVLARFWRTIVADLKINPIKFSELLSRYLFVTHNENLISANNARGSYHKKLAEKEFTWKVFLEGLRILGAYRIEFHIKIFNIDGHESTHSLNVLLSTDEDVEKFKKEWAKDHGIHQVDEKYLESLKSMRKDDIPTDLPYFDEVMDNIQDEKDNQDDQDHD